MRPADALVRRRLEPLVRAEPIHDPPFLDHGVTLPTFEDLGNPVVVVHTHPVLDGEDVVRVARDLGVDLSTAMRVARDLARVGSIRLPVAA